MYEREFLRMAIAEGGRPLEGYYTPENRAIHKLSFGIGMLSQTKDEFLKEGDLFLQNFDASVRENIRSEREDGDCDSEIIFAFERLIEQSKKVNREVFIGLLNEYWGGAK